MHPLYLLIPATACCAYAFMLPVATPGNAIILSVSGMSTIDMVIEGKKGMLYVREKRGKGSLDYCLIFGSFFPLSSSSFIIIFIFFFLLSPPPSSSSSSSMLQMRAGVVMNIACVLVTFFLINTLGYAVFDFNTLPTLRNITTEQRKRKRKKKRRKKRKKKKRKRKKRI